MQFQVEAKIEPSKSGKTFGVAIVKDGKTLMAIKGCKLANGANGSFVSGPSTKMDNGEWFNYLFIDKAFNEYLTGLAESEVNKPAPKQSQKQTFNDLDDSIPF